MGGGVHKFENIICARCHTLTRRCAFDSPLLGGFNDVSETSLRLIFNSGWRREVQKTPKNSLFGGMKCLESSLKIMREHNLRFKLRQERYFHNEVCVL